MDKPIDRRQFVRDGALLVAGAAAAGALAADQKPDLDPGKILNYHPEMHYRRLGKTGLVLSEISLGGHWRNRGASFVALDQRRGAGRRGQASDRRGERVHRRRGQLSRHHHGRRVPGLRRGLEGTPGQDDHRGRRSSPLPAEPGQPQRRRPRSTTSTSACAG